MISKLIAIVCCTFTIMSCAAMQNIMEDMSDDRIIKDMQIIISSCPKASQKLLIQLANCLYIINPVERNPKIIAALRSVLHYRKEIWQENSEEGKEICGDAIMFLRDLDYVFCDEIYTDPEIEKYHKRMSKFTAFWDASENEDLEESSELSNASST